MNSRPQLIDYAGAACQYLRVPNRRTGPGQRPHPRYVTPYDWSTLVEYGLLAAIIKMLGAFARAAADMPPTLLDGQRSLNRQISAMRLRRRRERCAERVDNLANAQLSDLGQRWRLVGCTTQSSIRGPLIIVPSIAVGGDG